MPETRFRALFAASPIGIFLASLDGRIIEANQAAADLLGRRREDLVGYRSADLTHPDDMVISHQRRQELVDSRIERYRIEKRYVHADGEIIWVQLNACLLRGDDGEEPLVLAQVQDITERRHQQEQLAELAIRDPLTSLLNRRGFSEALDRECERARRYGESFGLLIVDLDRFKAVNDQAGHLAGDRALVAVADVLRARLRRTDLIARHGGDEFAAILLGVSETKPAAIAEEIKNAISDARIGLPERPVSAAIGWASLRDQETPWDLLARADREMYEHKRDHARMSSAES